MGPGSTMRAKEGRPVERHDLVVRFAGEGGQGVVTAADALARAAAQVGYHVVTYTSFPSQIMGGPTFAQVRVTTHRPLSAGDHFDVLVALNTEAYELHIGEMNEGGALIYDSEGFEPTGDHIGFGLPVEALARESGNTRAANMVMIGAVAGLVGFPTEFTEEFIRRRFSRGHPDDQGIIDANIRAVHLGEKAAGETRSRLGLLSPPEPSDTRQMFLNGNTALALGAYAAGVEFFAGYPISPATAILVWMENNLTGPGKVAHQTSSEIESINAIIGASFAGKKAMTATSGPGISLMAEGLGLAWMAEIPLVVVNVQRGGPATGMPTKTEQSDLYNCLYPSHGDAKLPVMAPGSVTECFYAMIHAFNWAERYQGPIIVLSEMQQVERTRNVGIPDLDALSVERRNVFRGDGQYRRYEADGVSPMPLPGGPGPYIANGSEHDAMGDTTHRTHWHVHGTERRFSKVQLLENDPVFEVEDVICPVMVMPWGGTRSAAREAYDVLRGEGVELGWAFTMFLHPLPPALLDILLQKELVIVPELNYLGQWSSILRGLGVRAESITQYSGTRFEYTELTGRLRERINDHRNGRKSA